MILIPIGGKYDIVSVTISYFAFPSFLTKDDKM